MKAPTPFLLVFVMILRTPLTVLGADDPKGKAVADAALGSMNAANLLGIKVMAEREIYGMKDKLIEALKGAAFGTGVLFDVQIYERPDGGNWSPRPLQLGFGQKPFDIVLQSEQHGREHGKIANLEPSGFFFSKSKSYMLWATLDGKRLTVRTMSPENREVLFASAENRLREQPKPEPSPAK